MTDQNQASQEFANTVYDQILDNIFLPAAAGETVDAYFQRLGIDPKLPPIEFIKVLERVKAATVQLSHANIWVIAMRFTALLFAMREQDHAKIAIRELAKTMPEFPLESLLDQAPSEYANDVLHPESSEARALEKLNVLLDRRIGTTALESTVLNQQVPTPAPATKTRQILHVKVGNPDFQPTDTDLENITAKFNDALEQGGSIVTTRFDVETSIVSLSVAEGAKNMARIQPHLKTVDLSPSEVGAYIWELYEQIKINEFGAVIDASGLFMTDADNSRFPLYARASLGDSYKIDEPDDSQ